MTKVFKFHSDPSHAWLEVTRADLRSVGLAPGDFSAYSYRDIVTDPNAENDRFFLEEDCDAGKFLQAYCKANNLYFSPYVDLAYLINEQHCNRSSSIRLLSAIK